MACEPASEKDSFSPLTSTDQALPLPFWSTSPETLTRLPAWVSTPSFWRICSRVVPALSGASR